VNLGTPDSPDFFSVRTYLKEFLWDRRVIEVNRVIWWLILNGIILNIRPLKSAKLYRAIWTKEGSPLLVESRKQVEALQKILGDGYVVALGMRYGAPSLKVGLLNLRQAGVESVVILPLYPQHSGATTGSTFDAITALFQHCRHVPKFKFITDYFKNSKYIEAMKVKIEDFQKKYGKPQKLIFSFHGLPQSYVDKGDPYFLQCHETSRLLAESLGLSLEEWSISFQSRVGRMEWLRPYTDEYLKSLPKLGVTNVQVFCPGFSSDCLETLEEIAIQNKKFFMEAGGHTYRYIPALNHSAEHIGMMADLVKSA
jgi:ferrochelatase